MHVYRTRPEGLVRTVEAVAIVLLGIDLTLEVVVNSQLHNKSSFLVVGVR